MTFYTYTALRKRSGTKPLSNPKNCKVQRLIKSLKIRKAPGFDGINNKAIKRFSLPLLGLLIATLTFTLKIAIFSHLERGEGVTLERNLHFKDHIERIRKNAFFYRCRLGAMLGRKSILLLRNKRTIYKMCIRLAMTYMSPVFAHAVPKGLSRIVCTPVCHPVAFDEAVTVFQITALSTRHFFKETCRRRYRRRVTALWVPYEQSPRHKSVTWELQRGRDFWQGCQDT
ncbi:hypothetical protein EVAR_102848_1 [Eumeta japonica]|uniref:Uncharacterized protein n=1 Tax=Eumeta variegata TaxID=151549 RepID=A0A4C1UNM9_EUMVA|nr:hypothetical protein EVAR_102848_1 [Eumeta japonica]